MNIKQRYKASIEFEIYCESPLDAKIYYEGMVNAAINSLNPGLQVGDEIKDIQQYLEFIEEVENA